MPFEFINQNILLVSIVVVSGLGLIWPMFVRGANQLSPAEVTQLINRENAHIIDVREANEFAQGHLPEARHIPAGKLAEQLDSLAELKDKPVVVCCASGMRSSRAGAELKKHGFSQVYNLAGGVDAWVGAGLPIKKGNRNK